jgi:hypothetical protein
MCRKIFAHRNRDLERERERERDLRLKPAFLEKGAFLFFLQNGVLFLQFLVPPTSPSVLEPNGNLARLKTQFRSEAVLSFRLQLMFISEVRLKLTHLFLA